MARPRDMAGMPHQPALASASSGGTFAYGAAVLAGAALVFQVQPIAGKVLLPSFGGGASVWTACMFFFQAMLLAGYAYAHLLSRLLAPRAQAAAHAVLLLLSLLFLPAWFDDDPVRSHSGEPVSLILLALTAMIGFPFVMLASTAPLMQRWSSMTDPRRMPWRLYALSNAAALAALLTYPLLVEPNLSLDTQALAWSAGYGVFVLCALGACYRVWQARMAMPGTAPADSEDARVTRPLPASVALLTLLLAACGVVMLLAVTNEITQNVAPVPFLWILPLVVYLLTYIICFGGDRWYDRAIWGSLFVVSASSLVILHFFATSFPLVPVVLAYTLVLFCTCIVCHAELYRLRPDPRNLTSWYLLIALGGAMGGAFVSVVAPAAFTRYWEGLAGVFLLYLIFGVVILRENRGRLGRVDSETASKQARIETWGLRLFALAWTAGIILFPALVASLNELRVRYDVASTRNFYGLLNVRDVVQDGVAKRLLVDGTTMHGFQLLAEEERNVPTSYYGANTGIAMVMEQIERSEDGLKVGIIGLGTGTLAAYAEPRDEFRFYELNPSVVEFAKRHFSFLDDSPGTVDVVLGDGRVSLQRELDDSGSRDYDILVVDAFNSDAIPVHLLTLEALQLYWSHLDDNGVLALHLTNNYLDLVPVASNLGARLGKQTVLVTTPRDIGATSAADWVLMGKNPGAYAGSAGEGADATELSVPELERVWTDDYSNLLGALLRGRRMQM